MSSSFVLHQGTNCVLNVLQGAHVELVNSSNNGKLVTDWVAIYCGMDKELFAKTLSLPLLFMLETQIFKLWVPALETHWVENDKSLEDAELKFKPVKFITKACT